MNFETFDAAYIDRLRDGDAETERHFVVYFSELIQLKLRSRIQSPQLIEDIRQETFLRTLKLLRSPTGIRQAERLGPLVNTICNNVFLEQMRSSHRADPLEDETAAKLRSHTASALSQMITHDTRKTVRRVLDTLSLRDRTVLRAIFLEERDKQEVCDEMGVDRDYIRVLLHRAKNSFRTAYAQAAPEKIR